MTANNNIEVSAYWATHEKETVIAKLPRVQYEFASLEKLYDHAHEAGWLDIDFPQGADLPPQAVAVSEAEIDEAIREPEEVEEVDLKTEAFSSLVCAKGHCDADEYDAAIECALDAIECLRRLRAQDAEAAEASLYLAERAGTARFGVEYEDLVPKYYCLFLPDQKRVKFESLLDMAEFVKSEGLREVKPAGSHLYESALGLSRALAPLFFDKLDQSTSTPEPERLVDGVQCPEKRIWIRFNRALKGQSLEQTDEDSTAHLVVWYEEGKPKSYRLLLPAGGLKVFTSQTELAEFARAEALAVEPATADMCPAQYFLEGADESTGNFPPDDKLWAKVQKALQA